MTGDRVYGSAAWIIAGRRRRRRTRLSPTRHASRRGDERGRDIVYLPDTDTRTIAVRYEGDATIREVRPCRRCASDNDFFFAVAAESARGEYPRYLHREQSYWTILGGTDGEEAEALLSEDGTIEAGNARFSIEPFLWIDGKLVTWNDVAIEQREGPAVVWKKHLTVTPSVENNQLHVLIRPRRTRNCFWPSAPFR